MKKSSLIFIPVFALALTQLQGCATAVVAGTVTAVSAVNDPRSLGTQIDDSSIEVKAMLELMKDDGLDKHTHLNVISYNGAVLVVGQAPNKFLVDTAINILKKIKGVKQVHNQIKLGTPVSFTTKTNDAWITTKVKTDLLTDDHVKGHDIKVVTENKVVYLMGLVSEEQGNKAAQRAANIAGVEQVIKVFEAQ
jgi:osmotically-inducible protein OsmY